MNITLTIPDKHVPELMAVIASLLAETQVEQAQDPAPDHPDLELGDEDPGLAETRLAVVEKDPTQRVLPWDYYWPDAPSLPNGKKRWVYRGKFPNKSIDAARRYVFYLHPDGWVPTASFSAEYHHIEAI